MEGAGGQVGGSHSSKRFPSGAVAQPNRPCSDSSVFSSTSSPRCTRYQSASFSGSRALKNTPPMPMTLSMGER
jgi:hypothetical protein